MLAATGYERASDGTESYLLGLANWNWDGPVGDRWARFWVILFANGMWPYAGGSLGAATPATLGGTTATLGTSATIEHVAMVRSIVADQKPAGTRCVSIIIAHDGGDFDPSFPEPDGNWGGFSKNSGGTQVVSRLNVNAHYWEGTGGTA